MNANGLRLTPGLILVLTLITFFFPRLWFWQTQGLYWVTVWCVVSFVTFCLDFNTLNSLEEIKACSIPTNTRRYNTSVGCFFFVVVVAFSGLITTCKCIMLIICVRCECALIKNPPTRPFELVQKWLFTVGNVLKCLPLWLDQTARWEIIIAEL